MIIEATEPPKMRLKWFEEAIADLTSLREYIGLNNPTAAVKVASRILEAVKRLETHPGSGRRGRVKGTRELVISGTHYIIPYREKDGEIQLLRVLHAAQQWPKTLKEG